VTDWWAIEILHGERFSANRWWDAHRDALIESAITHGALDWSWQERSWGGVFEVEFADEFAADVFFGLPGVRAALDAVPDPTQLLSVHRGRGGAAGVRHPRRPLPQAGGGVAELPPPDPLPDVTTVHLHAEAARPARATPLRLKRA
jgi:hypothetical protein